MAEKKLVGQNYSTPDLRAKVTGRARYADDFHAQGMLFARLLEELNYMNLEESRRNHPAPMSPSPVRVSQASYHARFLESRRHVASRIDRAVAVPNVQAVPGRTITCWPDGSLRDLPGDLQDFQSSRFASSKRERQRAQ